jgi:hypothetical protein
MMISKDDWSSNYDSVYFQIMIQYTFKLWFNILSNFDSMIVLNDYADEVVISNDHDDFEGWSWLSQVMILNDIK